MRVAGRSLQALIVALLGSASFGVLAAHAQDATWVGGNGVDPSEWEEPANWTPATIPTDTATFTNTGVTTVANDAGIVLIGAIDFTGTPNAQAYTINIDNPFIVNGAGVTNNSTNTQTFNVSDGNSLVFQNASTANNGTGAVAYNNSFQIFFENTSNAGNANTTYTNSEDIQFDDSSSAGSANFTNNIQMDFFSSSTAGSANITNASTGTITFNNTATAGAAVIGNSGTIDFNNSSTAGNATITTNSGASVVFTGTSSGGSAAFVTNTGGTFDISGLTSGGTTAGSIAGAGNYFLGGNTLTVGSLNTSTTVSGVISDGGASGGTGGSLVKVGTGTLTLTGADTYTGTTTVNGGTLMVGNGAGGSISNSSALTNNATFEIENNSSATFGAITNNGLIGQGGTLTTTTFNNEGGATLNNVANTLNVTTLNNSGTVNFQGTLNATTINNSGTFDLTGALQAGTTIGTFNQEAGTFNLGGEVATIGAVALSGGTIEDGNLTAPITATGGTVNGISGSASLTVTSGDVTLATTAGSNTFTGATTVNGGTLLGGAANAFSAASATTINTGGTVDLGGFAQTINTVMLAGGTIQNGSLSGAISSTGGTVNGIGGTASLTTNSGTTTMLGNNTYSGGTAINGGTVAVGSNNALGTALVTMAAGTTLSFLNTGSFTVSNNITIAGGTFFTPPAGTAQTISGVIADGSSAGTLNMTGAGTLILSGVNTYTGGTVLSSGILQVTNGSSAGNSSSVGTGTVTLNGGVFQAGGSNLSFNNPFAINTTNGTVDTQANTLTLSGTIADGNGAGALTKIGSGTLILTGADTYSGGTTISAGTLQLGNGGTSGSITGNVGDNGILAFDRSNTVTFAGVISGNGAVAQIGSGTTILTGTNTYGGGTTVSAGTLQIGNGGAAGSIAGNVTDNGTLAFDLSSNTAFAGAISGGGAVTQEGTGTLTLSGSSAYTGATTVAAGDLDVSGSLGSTAVTVQNGATLSGTGTIAGPVTLVGGGTLMPGSGGSPGTITVGPLTINAGSFLSYQLGTPGISDDTSDLTKVNGNLTINGGTLNVTSSSVMPGVYEIIGYSGTLGGGGALAVGTLPPGDSGVIQTVIPGEVNLVVSSATAITQFWDGATMAGDGTIHGGSGTWNANNTNWTSASGQINSNWQGGVAVFAGAAGTVTVASAISYQGLQFMTTGFTLTASGGGTLAPVGMAPIIVGSGLSDTILTPIVGTGGVQVNSAGSLVLGGANTYSGGTVLSDGTLVIGNNAALGSNTLTMMAGTTLSFLSTGNFTVANPIAMSGDPNFAPPSGTAQTLSGVISGTGTLNMTGAGTLVLSATNTYTGPTNVNSGILDVTGSIASSSLTTVASGAALTGAGTIGNLQVGGTFQPGSGTAGSVTTIAGNLAFQSGAVYLVQVSPSTASSTSVSGTASLAGTVNAVFASGSYVAKQYTVLQSAGLNGTTFSALTTTNLPAGIDASLAYTSGNVMLDLSSGLPTSGLTVNEQNVANALSSYFNAGGTLPPGFAGVFGLTGASLANALTQLDGEDATGAEHSAIELTNEFLSLMLDPFVYGRGGPASGGGALGFAPDQEAGLPPEIALAYAGVLKAPPKPQNFDQRWTVWGAGYGGSGSFDGNAAVGSTDLTASTYGFAAGADYHAAPDLVLGFALAGAGTNWDLANALGTGRSDAFQAGLYGTKYFGPAYLGTALAFTNNWFSTNRFALGDQLSANFQGQSYGVRVEGGYRYAVAAAAGITPYAAIQAQSFRTPSYSETDLTGGGFGLTYNAMSATDTRSELGARFDDLTMWGTTPVQFRARVAWAHDWVSNPALDAAFQALPGTSFVVNGAPVPHNSALASVGTELHLTPQWTLIGKFDGEFASAAQIYAGSGTLRYSW